VRDRLTAKLVENAKPGRYGDGGGLWLEVSTSGARHWTLRYQLNGRARWMGLGGADVVTLADARERRAQAATITFREAANAVIEIRESDWSAEHARQWRASIDEVDPTLGSLLGRSTLP
jgi:Arm DNA-binding domain